MKTFLIVALILPLAAAVLYSSTQNDVTSGGACKAMTVLFARGTTEIGNMGTLVGPLFVSAIGRMMGDTANVAVQGITYPADIPGFLVGGDQRGSSLMAQMVKQVRANCPNTALVIAGYSQGGQLVHNAADMLNAKDTNFVSSTVIFGDPDNGRAVGNIPAANTKIFCAMGDLICAGQPVILAAHLSYGLNVNEAAQFVVSNMAARRVARKAGSKPKRFVS